MTAKISTKEAKRNRIIAETKRLTDLGLAPKEIALQLKVKKNLILRLIDLNSAK